MVHMKVTLFCRKISFLLGCDAAVCKILSGSRMKRRKFLKALLRHVIHQCIHQCHQLYSHHRRKKEGGISFCALLLFGKFCFAVLYF